MECETFTINKPNSSGTPTPEAEKDLALSMACLSSSRSSPDKNGHTHRVDTLIFGDRHDNFTVYEGKCFSYNKSSHDPRHGDFVMVKFRHGKLQQNGKDWVLSEVQNAKEAQACGQKFNQMMKSLSLKARVRIMVPQYAQLQKDSFLNMKRQQGEYFLFEDKLEVFRCFVDIQGREKGRKKSGSCRPDSRDGEPQPCRDNMGPTGPPLTTEFYLNIPYHYQPRLPTYEESQAQYGCICPPPFTNNCMTRPSQIPHQLPSCPVVSPQDISLPTHSTSLPSGLSHCHDNNSNNNVGNMNNMNSNNITTNWEEETPFDILHAFIHMFFCHSGGQRIVTNLKGEYEEDDVFTLTTPTIHSIGQTHGHRDQGEAGIRSVIEHHRCSGLCYHLPNMSTLLENALTQSTINKQ